MFRSTAIAVASFGGLACAALTMGGCADLMQRSTIAPEWFQAKAIEVKGQGYPKIADIPEAKGSTADQAQWDAAATSLQAEAAKIDAKLSEVANPTEEEIRATAAQLRAQVENRKVTESGAQPQQAP
jgi:hypothetical protein